MINALHEEVSCSLSLIPFHKRTLTVVVIDVCKIYHSHLIVKLFVLNKIQTIRTNRMEFVFHANKIVHEISNKYFWSSSVCNSHFHFHSSHYARLSQCDSLFAEQQYATHLVYHCIRFTFYSNSVKSTNW